MKYFKIMLLLCSFCSFYCCTGNSQEEKSINQEETLENSNTLSPYNDYEIRYIDTLTEYNRYYTRIDFVEKKTGIITNSFDIKKNNPFSIPQLKQEKTSGGGQYHLNQYDLNGIKKEVVKGVMPKSVYDSLIYEDFKVGFTTASVWTKGKNHTAVSYQFQIWDSYCSISYLNKIIVIDNTGEVIKTLIVDDNWGLGGIVVSKNAKYLCFSYGDITCEGEVPSGGVKLMNLSNLEVIWDLELSSDKHSSSPFFAGSKIIFSVEFYEKKGRYYKYYVFDSNNENLYSKVYNYNDLVGSMKWNEVGVVFTINGKTKEDLFISSFIKEDLKYSK